MIAQSLIPALDAVTRCFSVGKNNRLKGNIDHVGKEIVVVHGMVSATEYTIPKSDLLDEDGQPIPERILKHEQALIDLEKEFADVADDSLIGEIRQIKKLAQNIANNLNIMKNKC